MGLPPPKTRRDPQIQLVTMAPSQEGRLVEWIVSSIHHVKALVDPDLRKPVGGVNFCIVVEQIHRPPKD